MAYDAAHDELSSLLGNRLSRSKSDLDIHGRSETYFAPTPPDAVAYPDTTEEVSRIVRICAAHRCPVVAWRSTVGSSGLVCWRQFSTV